MHSTDDATCPQPLPASQQPTARCLPCDLHSTHRPAPPSSPVFIPTPLPVLLTLHHRHRHHHLQTRASTTASTREGPLDRRTGGNGDVAGGRGEGRVVVAEEGEAGAGQGADAAVPAARGGAGVDAVAGALHPRRQHHRLHHRHVLQQLPRPQRQAGARRPVRRRLPPPLLLPAPPPEPAPRPLLRNAGEDGRAGVGQGGARAPGVAPLLLHVDARRRPPPRRQHAQPPLRRPPPRAAVRIRADRRHLPHLRRGRERAVVALHPERHLGGRLGGAVRAAGGDAGGAAVQLDHLQQQGGGGDHAALRRRRQPGAGHPAARQQLRPHRGLPHRVPPGLRAAHAPPLRVDGALPPPRRQPLHRQEVPPLPVGSHGRRPHPRRRRIRDRAGHGVPRRQRQQQLRLVPLPQLRPHRELVLRQLSNHQRPPTHTSSGRERFPSHHQSPILPVGAPQHIVRFIFVDREIKGRKGGALSCLIG